MPRFALVVENDDGTQRLLQVLLQRRGFEVDVVRSGSEALLLLRRIPYAIVTLDLMLPHVNGTTLLETLRAELPHMLRRTIVVSSAAPSMLEQIAISFSEVPQLRKPFEIEVFTAMIDRHAAVDEEPLLDFDDDFCRASVRCHAKSGVVTRLNGRTLEVVTSFGYSGNELEKFFPLDLDVPLPICSAARGREVWYASLAQMGGEYPELQPVWNAHRSRALAALPVARGGAILGAVGWSFAEPQVFRGGERECLTAMAQMAAHHLQSESSTA